MYAVFVTGGKQYRAEPGNKLKVERLAGEEGSALSFDEVLLVAEGEAIKVGAPTVAGAKVTATIVRQGRAPKITVVKFRRRKHHRKQMGHRQYFTEIEITGVSA
jgi:large subunit ribosomal protein L21